jgi:hypothetical protein
LIIPEDARRWLVAAGGLFVAFAVPAIVLIGPLLVSPSVEADARSEYLIRLLQGSTQFRVRAQAAISLGGVEGASDVGDALAAALHDEHPAVRAAAANSLGRLADVKGLPALRAAAADPEPPVRVAVKAAITKLETAARRPSHEQEEIRAVAGPARYYVAIGKPASHATNLTAADLERAQQILRERLGEMDGVVIAPAAESPSSARGVLRARKLKGFYIDSSVTSVEQKPGGGVRAAVSLIVATYPDRAMRAIMQGAATAMGGGDIRSQAVAGAFKSALSQLPQAMTRD